MEEKIDLTSYPEGFHVVCDMLYEALQSSGATGGFTGSFNNSWHGDDKVKESLMEPMIIQLLNM